MTKICTKCKEEKDIGLFGKYKNRESRRAWCNPCRVSYETKSPATKEAQRKSSAKKRKKYPKKWKAMWAVGNAIRDGKLIRTGRCMMCEAEGKTNMHHDDYNEPLEVRELCLPCHRIWHKYNKAVY